MLLCEAGPHGPTVEVEELGCGGEQACLDCGAELAIKSGSADSCQKAFPALLFKTVCSGLSAFAPLATKTPQSC